MVFSFSGCTKKPDTESDITVTVIGKSNDTYWNAVKNASNDVSNETGVVTVYKAPPNEDVDAQIKIIDQAISDNTSAIVIAPVADEELHDSLAKAILLF